MDRPAELVPFQDLLLTQKDLTRDELAAAWQRHIGQVEEQLRRGWKDHLSRVFEERFRALSEGMEQEFQRRLSMKQAEVRALALGEAEEARTLARRGLAQKLNEASRRLTQAASAQEWISSLLEALSPYVSNAAFFSVLNGKVRFEAGSAMAAESTEVPSALKEIPAFAAVEETKDTVVCVATAGELTEPVLNRLGLKGDTRVYLLPVLSAADRLTGIVVAEPDKEFFDLNAAELICSVAGRARRVQPAPDSTQLIAGIASPSAPPAAANTTPAPDPAEETAERARRFARVKIAEIRLYHSTAVLEGRAAKKLYTRLQTDIDAAREAYGKEFPGIPDYFHTELLHTLANDDKSLLGAEYPGPLA